MLLYSSLIRSSENLMETNAKQTFNFLPQWKFKIANWKLQTPNTEFT